MFMGAVFDYIVPSNKVHIILEKFKHLRSCDDKILKRVSLK